jgi:hypothetical protein
MGKDAMEEADQLFAERLEVTILRAKLTLHRKLK